MKVQNLIGTDQRNVTFSPPTFSNFYQILKLTSLPAFKTPSLKGLEKKLASSSHACLVHATQSRTCFRNSAYAATTKPDLTNLSDLLKTDRSFKYIY